VTASNTTTGIFITGTDTDVGKTTIALGFITALKDKGLRVGVMKPVSAGCEQTNDGLRNEDAVLLMQQASVDFPYEIVNPYAFEPAVAPHIAAAEVGVAIDIEVIRQCYFKIAEKVNVVVVEGAGGWLVPINENETMADVVKGLSLDVITVVGIRLGCLNHALLTSQSIDASGLNHKGWIANHLSPGTGRAKENINTLGDRIYAPCLGEIKFNETADSNAIANQLNIDQLLL
jgi:dethiobiotin synthetase